MTIKNTPSINEPTKLDTLLDYYERDLPREDFLETVEEMLNDGITERWRAVWSGQFKPMAKFKPTGFGGHEEQFENTFYDPKDSTTLRELSLSDIHRKYNKEPVRYK